MRELGTIQRPAVAFISTTARAAVVLPLQHDSTRWRLGSRSVCSSPLNQVLREASSSRDRAAVRVCAGLGFGKAANKISKAASCPCGSGNPFKDCCKRYHDGELPPTPETLMRARFSAYAKGHPDFVCNTTHPDNPLFHGSKNPDGSSSSTLREDVIATCENISWDKLKVLSNEDGSSPDEAYVTFQTWFKVRGQQGQRAQGTYTQSFIERSRFLREDGRWLYVDGTQDWVKGGTGTGK